MRKIRYISFLLIISLFHLPCLFAEGENKAILIVPGVLSSGLFYNGQTNLKYYQNEALWLGTTDSKVRSTKAIFKLLIYNNDLTCDENGIPTNKNVGLPCDNKFPTVYDENIARYGVFSCYKKAIDLMEKKFGNHTPYNYKVLLYNYDWRLDCSKNSELLTSEIMKYDEVILIGYSLGGLISCKSACELLNAGGIDKIKSFISVATPYNGTVEPLYVLENGMVTGDSFMDSVIRFLNIPKIVRKIAYNCPAMYQLFPTRKFFERNPEGYIRNLSGTDVNSYSSTINTISSKPWYKKSDGTNKDFLNVADEFHNSLYVNNKHIINYINSYFIVGAGYKTMCKLNLAENSKQKTTISKFTEGDGTIPLNYSGLPPMEVEDNSRIFIVKSKHNEIFNNDNAINYMVDIIENQLKS